MSRNARLIESNDAAAVDAECRRAKALDVVDQTSGIDFRFVTLAQIDKQHAVRTFPPGARRIFRHGPVLERESSGSRSLQTYGFAPCPLEKMRGERLT